MSVVHVFFCLCFYLSCEFFFRIYDMILFLLFPLILFFYINYVCFNTIVVFASILLLYLLDITN